MPARGGRPQRVSACTPRRADPGAPRSQRTYGEGARARRARRAGALGRGDDSAGAPGQAPGRRRAGAAAAALTEAQKARLVDLFEEHGMHRGYMAALLDGLGGAVRKAAVHRELRAMGLRKGVLTPRQASARAHARPAPGVSGAALHAPAVRSAAPAIGGPALSRLLPAALRRTPCEVDPAVARAAGPAAGAV